MSTYYALHLADPYGVRLATIVQFIDDGYGAALDYTLNVGQPGTLTFAVPASFDASLFLVDGRVGVWRSINGRPPTLDGEAIWLIRRREYTDDATRITAIHANHLLNRRIAAYAAGTSYTNKSATAADNQIKTIVNENFGASISSADRDGAETQADVNAYLSVQTNLSLGASVAKAFTRRRIGEVVQELCEASTTAGTYLNTEIVAPTESTLELRTYATQRGVDHRATSGQPVILSPARGNIENVRLVEDYMDEATFIIAGGQGEGANRLIATAADTARMGLSPFGRIERFVDMSNVSDATQLQDEADAALRGARPRITLEGDLVETPATTRGIHFDLGDIVTVEYRGKQYDCRLDVIHETVSQGRRRSQIQLRSTT
jgi:hypothetical protein